MYYDLFGWCEEHIGGWFVPLTISTIGLAICLPPFIKGIRTGMNEAQSKPDNSDSAE